MQTFSRHRSLFSKSIRAATTVNHHHRFGSLTNRFYRDYSKVVPFNLADIGEGIKEVEVVSWSIKEGDSINEFDMVAEVKSDKANVEITSRYTGKVKRLHYKTGDIALVGYPLIDIEVSDDTAVDDDAIEEEQQPQQQSVTNASETTVSDDDVTEASISKVLTTPAVRRIAREHQIDLTKVKATGPKGRLLKEDLLNYLSNPSQYSISATVKTTTTTTGPAASQTVTVTSTEDVVELVRGIKRTMIKTMNAANKIPHFGLSDDIRVDRLVELRKEMRVVAEQQQVKLTFMPFFIKAASLTLKQYPILNSSLSEDETQITYRGSHNIGVAMDTPDGLLVPVIKNVQNLTIIEIAKELSRLMELGAKGKLGANDLSGGTFSLSNIGTIGGTYASPLLPPGNVGIGAIGKITKTPIFDESDRVIAAQIMNISWSADHRIIDGATLARFSKSYKQYLENPSLMLLELK